MDKTYLFVIYSLGKADDYEDLVSQVNKELTIPLDWHYYAGRPVFYAKGKVGESFKLDALDKIVSKIWILQELTWDVPFPRSLRICDADNINNVLYYWSEGEIKPDQ